MVGNCSAYGPSSEGIDRTAPTRPDMSALQREQTRSTPEVHADPVTGRLFMSGDSYPENSYEFFNEIIAWVEAYLEERDAPLQLELRLAYLNTSSVRAMLDIFDLLEDAHQRGRAVGVDWLYHPANERVADVAEEFREDCSFPFEIKPDEPQ